MVKFLLLIVFLVSCQPASLSPHTKRGQAKINIEKVQTPYHIQHIVTEGVVPLIVKWSGPANYYTVYRDLYDVNDINIFEGTLSVFEKGDYRVKVFLVNDYWYVTSSSRFKIY